MMKSSPRPFSTPPGHRFFATLALTALLLAPLPAPAQAPAPEQQPSVGDAPADPGPLAALSGATQPEAVQAAMRKVADWQLARVRGTHSQDWTFATLYLGLATAANSLHDPHYSAYVQGVAEHYAWTLGPRQTHADDQAIGQSYLALYSQHPDPARIAPLQRQFDALAQLPDDPEKPVWWWCDALFMAPPVWAQLARVTRDGKYLDTMDREWSVTANLLWDPEEHLFSRDKSFLDKREKNGRKVFWSRGNGWVMGGLARVLTFLPADAPSRPFYLEKFRQMAESVRALQGADGLWRPGLLDATDYPLPEISGSAFFVYAMAWGVNHGILDPAVYRPVIDRGWQGLVAHIYQDGRLGSIQPIGAAPGEYTPGSSYVFGVGAFLLAGSEVAQLPVAPAASVLTPEQLAALAAKLDPGATGAASAKLAEYPNHYTMIAMRAKNGRAELHENFADVFVILSGHATLVTGGKVIGGKTVGPGEILGDTLEGGTPQALEKGDVVHIPAGVSHQIQLAEGGTLTYFVIKVKEK